MHTGRAATGKRAAARSFVPASVPLLCELALPLVVRLELGHDALAKDAQGCQQSVELVQRVGAARLRVDVELELVSPVAVGVVGVVDVVVSEVVELVVGVVAVVTVPVGVVSVAVAPGPALC